MIVVATTAIIKIATMRLQSNMAPLPMVLSGFTSDFTRLPPSKPLPFTLPLLVKEPRLICSLPTLPAAWESHVCAPCGLRRPSGPSCGPCSGGVSASRVDCDDAGDATFRPFVAVIPPSPPLPGRPALCLRLAGTQLTGPAHIMRLWTGRAGRLCRTVFGRRSPCQRIRTESGRVAAGEVCFMCRLAAGGLRVTGD